MNQIEGKTTSEMLALTQVIGELVAGGTVERAEHADGIHYYMPIGSKTFEVSIDVTDANKPPVATAVVGDRGSLIPIEERLLQERIDMALDVLTPPYTDQKAAQLARILRTGRI